MSQDEKYFEAVFVSYKEGPGGLPAIFIHNTFGEATISLLGANVIDWTPKDSESIIWLSSDATFEQGKSIRGGVPICWPWFGAHESNADFPGHGFARTELWKFDDMETNAFGETRVSFVLPMTPENKTQWPFETELHYHVTLGKTLGLKLVTHNTGKEPITITQALHTYFSVSDVSQVTVSGLEDKYYLDKVAQFEKKQQQGVIGINHEVDRIYLDTTDECVIEDPAFNTAISITKTGSNSTVVWNPGEIIGGAMSGVGKVAFKKFLCVESSNAADDIVTIEPGEEHELAVKYEVKNI